MSDGRVMLGLGVIWAALWFIVWPDAEIGINDDWAFARAAITFAEGEPRYTDWQSMPLFSQAWWGAAWIRLFGFSFFTLRLSTWVLALIGGFMLYHILRSRGAEVAAATAGALLLLFNPLYLHLSLTFMTDVFTLVFALCGYHFLDRIKASGYSHRRMAAAMSALLIAGLCRQTALFVPLGFIAVEGIPAVQGKRMDRQVLLGAMGSVVLVVAALLLHDGWAARDGLPANYGYQLSVVRDRIIHPSTATFEAVAYYGMNALVLIGISLLPVTIIRFRKWRSWEVILWVVLSAVLIMRMIHLDNWWPLTGDVWHPGGVGPHHYPGSSSAYHTGLNIPALLLALGALASVVVSIRAVRWNAALAVAVISLVPSVTYLSDRYLIMPLAFLLIAVMGGVGLSSRAIAYRCAAVVMIMGLYAVNEQVYYHRVQKAVVELSGRLSSEEQHRELNAGFAFNAWHRFEIRGFDQQDPGSSWPGRNTWQITPVAHSAGFEPVEDRVVNDLLGFDRIRLFLLHRTATFPG
jgi:hypothetical protein